MGHGHRYMYYMTGQPGWMRLGYSPGWAGRSASGLGPCAEYLQTGRWPGATTAVPRAADMQAGDLQVLKAQAEQLEQTLNRLRERIEQLEENGG